MRDLGPVLSPDQLVVTHVDVLQLGVEAEGGVHRPDVVVLELEPLYAGVEGDGQHLQLTASAGHGESHLVTLAGQRTEPVTRGQAGQQREQQHQHAGQAGVICNTEYKLQSDSIIAVVW